MFLRAGTLEFRDLIVLLEKSCPTSGTSEINSKLSHMIWYVNHEHMKSLNKSAHVDLKGETIKNKN